MGIFQGKPWVHTGAQGWGWTSAVSGSHFPQKLQGSIILVPMLGLKLTRTVVSTVKEWFYLPRFISLTHLPEVAYKVKKWHRAWRATFWSYLLSLKACTWEARFYWQAGETVDPSRVGRCLELHGPCLPEPSTSVISFSTVSHLRKLGNSPTPSYPNITMVKITFPVSQTRQVARCPPHCLDG